jgi:AraC family transcriptional regulator
MNPVAKALWFIESHFATDVTLGEIAEVAGVSRFHIVRVFGTATGYSVMRYVRARRLTEAARALANGAPDILVVALDAGYGSHEAFSRAFRDQFGSTPDAVRAAATVASLVLLEPIKMDEAASTKLQPPRMEDGRPLPIAGLAERYAFDNLAAIPVLWQRFGPHIGHVPCQSGTVCYGVCYNTDDAGFDYIAGVEVSDFSALPAEFARLRIAAQRYAVFTHTDHISSLRGTFTAIFNEWFPTSGLSPADAPVFERYDDRFDARTGEGGFEIWVPVKT